MYAGRYFVPFAGAYDLEAQDSGPIDELGNQRRLIAESERVQDACVCGSARKKRSGQRIRLDIDHHYVTLTPTGGKSVPIPAAGLPVASTITSRPSAAMSVVRKER